MLLLHCHILSHHSLSKQHTDFWTSHDFPRLSVRKDPLIFEPPRAGPGARSGLWKYSEEISSTIASKPPQATSICKLLSEELQRCEMNLPTWGVVGIGTGCSRGNIWEHMGTYGNIWENGESPMEFHYFQTSLPGFARLTIEWYLE